MPDACMRVRGTPGAAWHVSVSHVMLTMLDIPVMLTLIRHIITRNKHIIYTFSIHIINITHININNIIHNIIKHIRAGRSVSMRTRFGADLMADSSTDIMHARIMAINRRDRRTHGNGSTGRHGRGSPGATHVRF